MWPENWQPLETDEHDVSHSGRESRPSALRRLPQAPAPALQEQPFSRDAEEPRGFFDATVRFAKRVADERLFERIDGGGQRLIEAQPNFGLYRRVSAWDGAA